MGKFRFIGVSFPLIRDSLALAIVTRPYLITCVIADSAFISKRNVNTHPEICIKKTENEEEKEEDENSHFGCRQR